MTIWDPELRTSSIARAARLTETTVPAWGSLSASGMMAHVNDSIRMALGELPVKPKRMLFRHPPLKQLIVYALPFPKGVPTAPELLARCATAVLADERRSYGELLGRLAALTPGFALADHPAFGRLTRRAFGVLIARHTDHHFRQFGL